MRFLVSSTEVYRVDSEKEAKALIEEAKADSNYTLTKYASEYKEIKSKGAIADTYYKVTLIKAFNDIKDPMKLIGVNYISTKLQNDNEDEEGEEE
jgi:hypothetical protein